MENLVVALSNLTCWDPIWKSYDQGDLITFCLLSFVSLASFISHLFECHKHGMPGFGAFFEISPETSYDLQEVSYVLNRFDVLGVFLFFGRMLYLWWDSGLGLSLITDHWGLTGLLMYLFCLLRVSEYDKTVRTKKIFIITHSLWHLGIFIMIGKYLDIFYLRQ